MAWAERTTCLMCLMPHCQKACSAVRCSVVRCLVTDCLAIRCWPLRCRSCCMRSHHRLAHCRQNPGCWGRWDLGRARLAPILENRSLRSRTGRLAPLPVCSGRLSARRWHARRNRPRAPAPPLPASILHFPSCSAFYPTAHIADTLESRRMIFPSVTSGSRRRAILPPELHAKVSTNRESDHERKQEGDKLKCLNVECPSDRGTVGENEGSYREAGERGRADAK